MPTGEVLFDPRFATYDGLEIRYASSIKPSAEAVILLSPWPESIYAYLPMWPTLAEELSIVAVDLPGFGRSQGRPDLMGPRAMADFIVGFSEELGLQQPHAVGPDVGTGALLFSAAKHPGAFRSVIVGAGAATSPLHVDGALKAFIDADSIEDFRDADPGEVIRGAVGAIRNYDAPAAVRDDYVESYAGSRFLDSIAYVRSYPADLAELAPLLSGISTPVQIIVGRDDPYGLAVDAERLNEQLPHSRLNVFETGHNAWEEDAVHYSSVVSEWIKVGCHGV